MIDETTGRQIRAWAGDRCEYCGLRQDQDRFFRFHIEHIIAIQHGGSDESSNLALACQHCNLQEGPNLAGIDPLTGQIVPLFNPRTHLWDDHFELQGASVQGRTPEGRATVQGLAMNAEEQRELREEL